MKIRLLGWQSRGLRCPDLNVDIATVGKVPRVTLIQMPNGTGKTTTLSLIRAALTGSAESWTPQVVAEFKRKNDEAASGSFQLRLSVDDRLLTFELILDFIEGAAKYRTTSPSAGGVDEGWHPPNEVRRFLSEKFVSLFVFDGELASRMLDPRVARAEEAIDALCQLDLLDTVRDIAENVWERSVKDRRAKTQAGLSMWKNKEKALQERLATVEKAKRDAKQKLVQVEGELATVTKAMHEQLTSDEKIRTQLEELALKEKDAELELAKATDHAMQALRQPHRIHRAFSAGLVALKNHLDKAKLPDSTSRQFFIELADGDICVCGRPIGEAERKAVLGRADEYLGEDISGILNSLKQDIGDFISAEDKEQPQMSALLETLHGAEDIFHSIQTTRQGIKERLLADGNEDLQRLRARLEQLEDERDNLNDLLEEIERNPIASDDERTACITALKKQLDEAQRKISEITDTVDLRERTNIVREVATRAKESAREYLRAALVVQCNERLARILSADPVVIDSIQNSIRLKGQREASAGQTLAVGYTFLTAVLNRGAHEFPLIVDSPAGPLDDQVRKEVGAMVPRLCNQFVAFTISTERDHFLPALERAASGDVRYLTVFRKTAGTRHLLPGLPSAGVTQTDNAVLIDDKAYFQSFTLVTEGEV